ncbi:MAG TPA: tetratricopeptide repeat protein [Streptosporangiaceae bacterium]|nr:tetratricopeptide repeat protein [Streptosporangiaceae bacterium]
MSDQAGQHRQAWPVLSGTIPPLAPGFIGRPETGQGPWDGLYPGRTVILGPAGDSRVPARNRGGTGKTQLAVAFATRLWTAAGLDLLIWLDAGSRDSIVTGYARALSDIMVAAPPGKPEAAAAQLLAWLAETGRRWLVVLDGLAEAADAEGLWPQGRGGQVLVTTCLPGVTPVPVTDVEPVTISVPAFSEREAVNYLSIRLSDDPYHAAGSLDLALTVDRLPAGLAVAVTYLLDTGQDCRQYRLACERYRQHQHDDPARDALAPIWMLAFDRARQYAPADQTWPALKLAAVLGPLGIPGTVLTSTAACGYVTGRTRITSAEQAIVRATFGNLQRFGLVTIDPDDEVRTVAMAAPLQASVRQAMTAAELRQAARVAADAVSETWLAGRPAEDSAPDDVEQALRDCATGIRRSDALALWDQGCHPLLVRVGQSLDDARLPEIALRYWRDLLRRSTDYFGPRSPVTLGLRERVATAATAAGRADEAIGLRLELAADLDEVAGPAHPQAVSSRMKLAMALRAAGRLSDAISLGRQVAADCDVVFGQSHAQSTESLRELGGTYSEAGRHQEAIEVLKRCLTLREQAMGGMHRDTVTARHDLAAAYRNADQDMDAIRLYQDTLARAESTVGPAHPDTLTAREDLAVAYYQAGRAGEATAAFERALADWQRVPGARPEHTITARANLAAIYTLNGRIKEAIPLFEGEVADLEQLRGPAHADTLRARWNLAAACHKAKRLQEALAIGENTLADCEQQLGPGHWDTLTARANLAHAYHSAGLLKRASAHFDRALRDCERALGADDPLSGKVRALRKRYLAGRQGAAPIIAPPSVRRLITRLKCPLALPSPGSRRRRPEARMAGAQLGRSVMSGYGSPASP